MDRAIIPRLLIPLALLFAGAITLHLWLEWQGFWLNLSTEVVGILITVLYVDYIFSRHEAAKSAPADRRVRRRLQQVATVTLSRLRSSFGYGPDVIDLNVLGRGDDRALRRELVRLSREVLEPNALEDVAKLDTKGWVQFARHLQDTWSDLDKMLQLFGARLQPEVFAIIVDMQDAVFNALNSYLLAPDIVGVPDDELPASKKPGVSALRLREFLTEKTAEAVQRLSALAVQVVEWIDQRGA